MPIRVLPFWMASMAQPSSFANPVQELLSHPLPLHPPISSSSSLLSSISLFPRPYGTLSQQLKRHGKRGEEHLPQLGTLQLSCAKGCSTLSDVLSKPATPNFPFLPSPPVLSLPAGAKPSPTPLAPFLVSVFVGRQYEVEDVHTTGGRSDDVESGLPVRPPQGFHSTKHPRFGHAIMHK